jgi:imidazolonepropionase-like amidohydrolase
MTIDAARLLDVDKDRGELRVGLAADIIATFENPLENANALKRVTFVMKDGVVIKRGE